MIGIFINFLKINQVLSNLYCDSPCTSCSKGYIFKNVSCLESCPSNFLLESNKTCTSSSNLKLFVLDFQQFYHFESSSIQFFSSPDGLPFKSSSNSPIPVFGMGFYFKNTSKLVSNINLIPAPYFSIRVVFKYLSGNGEILKFSNDSLHVFRMYFSNSKLFAEWRVNQNTSVSYEKKSDSISNNWQQLSVLIRQLDGSFSVFFGDFYSIQGEFRGEFNDLKVTLGGSFQGFLNFLSFENDYVLRYNLNTLDYDVSEGYSLDNKLCTVENCSWCLEATSCNLNFWSTCTKYTGYQMSDCLTCDNFTAPYCGLKYKCKSGSFQNCQKCETGFSLINGHCTYLATNYNESTLNSPVFDLKFTTFEMNPGTIFQSGLNEQTFSPFNSPESDDPIYLKGRGLYFHSSRYLITKDVFRMNYQFTLILWAKSEGSSKMLSSRYFSINDKFSPIVEAFGNTINFKIKARFKPFYPYSKWYFLGVVVKNESDFLVMKTYFDYYLMDSYSIEGYQYVPALDDRLYLGTDLLRSFWTGYIFKITLWHKALTSFLGYSQLCGSNYDTSCLWNCSLNQYFNEFLQIYSECDSSCSNCVEFGTCSVCNDFNCETCLGFDLSCSTSFSSSCLSGLSLSGNGHCCESPCLDCFFSNTSACLSCVQGFYLLGQICVSQCPLGFKVEGNDCVLERTLILDLDFNIISSSITDKSSSILFSPVIYNPTPMMARGFYFNGQSYLQSPSLILSYNLTMESWFKLSNDGNLFSKSSFSISFGSLPNITMTDILSKTFSLITFNIWTYLIFSIETTSFKIFNYNYESSASTSKSSETLKIFFDSPSSLYIGSSKNAFSGFLYSFRVFNSFSGFSKSYFKICSNSNEINCLWSCGFNYYLSGSDCLSCQNSCETGCRRGESCNLCELESCSACNQYFNSCFECGGSSIFDTGSCICKEGFYYNETLKDCKGCLEKCLTCSQSTKCLTCYSNFSIDLNGSCECLKNQYENSGSCFQCSQNCETCQGPTDSDCLTCDSSIENLKLKDGTCRCLEGFFYNQNSKLCEKCQEKCANCKEKNNCLQCSSNYSKTGFGTCSCSEGEYEAGETCFTCSKFCKTCKGSSSLDCLSCYEFFELISGECFCRDGYFLGVSEESGIGSCDFCQEPCLDCKNLSFCLSCVQPRVVKDGKCFCPRGFYEDLSGCQECRDGCLICQTLDFCEKCEDGFFMDNQSCYCPSGSLLIDSQCKKCESSCLECLEFPSHCTRCKSSLFLSNGTCGCPESFVLINKFCLKIFENESKNTCSCFLGSRNGLEDVNRTLSTCNGCLEKCLNLKKDFGIEDMVCKESTRSKETFCDCQFYSNLILRIETFEKLKVFLVFSDSLIEDLTEVDLKIMQNEKQLKFKIKKDSKSRFEVFISEESLINIDEKLKIEFKKAIISQNNKMLKTKKIFFKLSKDQDSNSQDSSQTSKIGKRGLLGGIGISLILSCLTFQFSSFFNFLNFSEMFAVIALYDLNIREDLISFLISLRIQNSLPNPFNKLSKYDSNTFHLKRFEKYGFRSRSMLVNAGTSILTFFIIFAAYLLYLLLPKSTFTKYPKLNFLKKYFEYSVFMRFWIQACLELFISSLYELTGAGFQSIFLRIEFFFAYFSISIQVMMMTLLLILIYKKFNQESEEVREQFKILFGTFFDEFKDDNRRNCWFYLLFFGKRFVIGFSVTVIEEGIFSLTFSAVFSLSIIFYIWTSRCFKSKSDNFLHLSNEIITLLVYFTVLLSLVRADRNSEVNFTYLVIYLVGISWVINASVNCFKITVEVASWFTCCKKKKVIPNIEDPSEKSKKTQAKEEI